MTIYIIILVIFFIILICLTGEVLFRKYSKKKYGKIYKPVGKAALSDYVSKYEAYPYLPYLKKPQRADKNKSSVDVRPFAVPGSKVNEYDINELGFYDLCNPDKVVRDESKVCILLLGSSALEGIVEKDEKPYSIGLVLQEHLNKLYENKFQVITAAVAGWLSSELLIYSQLKLLDLKPDYVIYYHGANDVLAGSADNFKSDYSHYRRSISEVKSKIILKLILSSIFPFIPAFTLYEFLLRKSGLRFHPAYELSVMLRPNNPKIKDDIILSAEKRNIEFLAASIKQAGSRLIFLSYLFWAYDKTSARQNMQFNGVQQENEILRNISIHNNIDFIEMAGKISPSADILLDEQHFNFKGMEMFRSILIEGLVPLVQKELYEKQT